MKKTKLAGALIPALLLYPFISYSKIIDSGK